MKSIGTFSALTILIFFTACASDHEQPVSPDGIIDISESLVSDDAVTVRGPVEFYWDRLLLPSAFKDNPQPSPTVVLEALRPWTGLRVGSKTLGSTGIATYRVRFRVNDAKGRVGFWLPNQFGALRIFVNGKEGPPVGSIKSFPKEIFEDRQNISMFFEPAGGVVELIFHVANVNFYQGGMRAPLIAGTERAVRTYILRRTAFDVATLGVLIGAAVYHIVFFLMHRKETAFLIFSLLCLSLALHIPFQGLKSYVLFTPVISWEIQSRILAFLNAVSIPLGTLLLRSLFPDLVSRRALFLYAAMGTAGLLMQAGSFRIVAAGNLIYLAVMLPIFTTHALWVLWRAFRHDHSSALMALGVAALGCSSGLAIYTNWRGNEGGLFGISGYLVFVLFQSLALSRYFLGAVRAEVDLSASLRESRLALTRQREQLQVNLHDSLGGALTDLQIYTEQQMNAADSAASVPLSALHDRIIDTVKMFRSQLLLMEDLELTVRELLPGIQMTLLRRYADAGREIDFEVSPDVARLLEEGSEKTLPADRTLDLFFLAIELCTNDLKHGRGESFWRIGQNGSGLTLMQRNGIRNGTARPIQVPARASDRVHKLGGEIRAHEQSGEFIVEIGIPLRRVKGH